MNFLLTVAQINGNRFLALTEECLVEHGITEKRIVYDLMRIQKEVQQVYDKLYAPDLDALVVSKDKKWYVIFNIIIQEGWTVKNHTCNGFLYKLDL